MRSVPSISCHLLLAAAACAAPFAVGVSVWTGSVFAALLVVAACASLAFVLAVILARGMGKAIRQLHDAGSTAVPEADRGMYAPLMREAGELLDKARRDAERTAGEKTALEARAHVRKRDLHTFEAVLHRLELPVLLTDGIGQLSFRNRAATESGVCPPESDDIRPELRQLLDETRTRGAAADRRTAEFDLSRDGETVAYRATAWNIPDERGRSTATVAVLEDIRSERAEKTRYAQFVSSVCHELKTPMASIKGFIEMLMDGDVTDFDEQVELYGIINGQVDRLTRLVGNMLNLARIESGVIQVDRETCGLNEILEKCLEVIEPPAAEKSIRLVSELSELHLPVHADRDLLGQAVINLLSNAVKYTPEEGEVRLRSRLDGDAVIIEVRDTGMGIPAESLPRLFERFYRVPENCKSAAGTGLGLALARDIVTELHNGDISVESEVDRGTCFTLRLPLAGGGTFLSKGSRRKADDKRQTANGRREPAGLSAGG